MTVGIHLAVIHTFAPLVFVWILNLAFKVLNFLVKPLNYPLFYFNMAQSLTSIQIFNENCHATRKTEWRHMAS